jgi:hypothetical protein
MIQELRYRLALFLKEPTVHGNLPNWDLGPDFQGAV